MIFARLDAYGTDGDEFRRPRTGDCRLCAQPTLAHPCWPHRREALRELIIRRIDRALLYLHWHY